MRGSCISPSATSRTGDRDAVAAVRPVGVVWIMWLLDYNLSIAVAVGFYRASLSWREPAS